MFLLAHLGFAVAIAYVMERGVLRDRGWRIDYRLVLAGAVLPDFVDKPLALAGFGGGRSIAHTLLFAVVLSVLVGALGRRRAWRWAALGLAVGVWLHLALDAMWEAPDVLLWPAYGLPFPVPEPMDLWRLLMSLLASPVLLGEEIMGGALLIGMVAWKKMYSLPALRRFLSSGFIE